MGIQFSVGKIYWHRAVLCLRISDFCFIFISIFILQMCYLHVWIDISITLTQSHLKISWDLIELYSIPLTHDYYEGRRTCSL